MRIHLLSDIHIDARKPPRREQGKPQAKPTFVPSVTEADDVDVVVLAGDIHEGDRGVKWAIQAFSHMPSVPVLYVAGNHEFWGGNLQNTLQKMKEAAQGSQVRVLQRDDVVISGVRFLGTTGWCDYGGTGNQAQAMLDAQQWLRDHKRIRHGAGYSRWSPKRAQAEAHLNRSWLRTKLEELFDGPTVVITHHPLSMASVREKYENLPHLSAAFGNRWEDLLLQAQEAGVRLPFALHGHTHDKADYCIGTTRVVCNAVGHEKESAGHDPWLILEVAGH